MDGTLTQNEKFTSKLLKSLENLAESQIPVIIVTGRSAGWVEGLRHYLPIMAAIAENGGGFYGELATSAQFLSPIEDIKAHRGYLFQVFQELCLFYPQLQESTDNLYRLTDWTFDITGLNSQIITHLKALTEEKGLGFTYSTVQCHLKPLGQDKATGLKNVLRQFFPKITPDQVLTIGDSPNDDPLFNTASFSLSVGVANLKNYQHKLSYHPAYLTQQTEVNGFIEIADLFKDYLNP